MAGRAGRVRKARGRHEAQSRELRRQMDVLQGYVSAYNWLSSGGPSREQRKIVIHGTKHRNYEEYQGFTFWRPEQKYAKTQPRSRVARVGIHRSSTQRRMSEVPGLIEEYKQKAIQAELYGIPNLQKQIDNREPFDSSSVGSRRKFSRGAALKAAKDSGMSMSKVTGSQALKLQSEGKLLSAATVKAQQELSDRTGVVTFDMLGNISTVPKEGPINFEAMGIGGFDPNSKQGQHIKKVTQELLESRAPEQLKDLADEEKKLREKLAYTENLQLHNPHLDLYSDIDRLKSDLAKNESLQGVVYSAYSMGDHQALMKAYTRQYEGERGNKESVAFDFMMYSDPSNPVVKQQIAANQVTIERHENMIKNISTDLARLKNMKKNKKDTSDFLVSIKSKYGIILNEKTTTDANIINALEQKSAAHKEVRADIKSQQKILAVKMLGDMSNEEKKAYVKKQHASAKEIKAFEDITGIDTSGKTESQSVGEWLYRIGAATDVKREKLEKSSHSDSAWYQSWLVGDQFLTINPDERQLSLYGETDSETFSEFMRAKGILSKYGEWDGGSSSIAKNVSGKWKSELTEYYNQYILPTNVTKRQVASEVWGTEKIEGDSFVGYVANRMGGVRGGAYWVQDVRKLVRETEEHEKSIEKNIAARKELLAQHTATRESKLGIINESQKLIKDEVESAITGGKPTNINQDLANTLRTKSNELYLASYNKAATEAELEYLEKSLEKTKKERESLAQELKQQEFYEMQGDTRPLKKRVTQSRGRPSLRAVSSRSRSQPSAIQRRQTTRGMRRRDGLGGLVV